MSLPPVTGLPEDGPPDLPDWFEADWLECEAGLERDEPSEAELSGSLPDPVDGAPCDGFAAGGPFDSMDPGAALAWLAAGAFDAGLNRLSDDELVGVLLAARRLSSWQAALECTAVTELDARRKAAGSSRASEHVSEELAAALVLTGRSADALLGLSRELDRLYMVLASLRAGRIDRARAVVFADELALLPRIEACAIAAALIRPAEKMTTSQLRAAIRALILAACPGSKEERDRKRAERARSQARVEIWPEPSGNAALAGRELPVSDAIAADQRLTAIARKLMEAGVPGTLDQLRVAAYSALLIGRDLDTLLPDEAGQNDPPPARWRPAPGELATLSGTVNLTMPLASWLDSSDAPGEAAGYGPLGADDCRDLANDLAAGTKATWCLTLTGPDGRAVAHGCARASPKPGSVRTWLAVVKPSRIECGTCTHERQTRAYRPPEMLRHLVCIRQRTCSFPGCRRPAERCDLDHTTPFDQGGRTCQCNLSPLCRRHHQTKQAPGWHLTQPEPGTLIWTAPHGRTYQTEPGRYPI